MKRKTIVKVLFASVLLLILSAVTLVMPGAEAAGTAGSGSLNVTKHNLAFENDVHILYAIESNDPDVQLLVWNGPQEAYTCDTPHDTAEVAARNYDIDGVLHTVFTYDGLAAKQMADTVYVRAYNSRTGEYGSLDKYSILQYAYNKLGKTGGNPTADESLCALLTQMLEYGATAQTYFGYKPDRLANANWVQIQVEGGALEDGFPFGLYLPGDTAVLTAPATNAEGTPFSHWLDANQVTVGKATSCTIAAGSANQTYTAVYQNIDMSNYSQGLTFTSNGDGTCSVSGIGTCTDLDVKIPPVSPEGERVTGIGDWAFDCSGLTSITIPDSVTSIGYRAFSDCSGLTSITIPDGVTSIGGWAFSDCSSLTSITILEGVTSIDEWAFSDCSSLTSITILEGVTSIGNHAFSGCNGLTSITIPESVTSIGNSAFSGCSGLTSITIPEGVTSIGDFAFFGCSSLTSITIPVGVTGIGDYAFSGCSGLTSITIPEGITGIGNWAFSHCSGLTSITIPEGITGIGNWAFSHCSGLTSITIPESVTSIGYSAFSGCSGLTSITIPESVTSIGDSAFSGCSGLTSITIPEGVTGIGNSAFHDCSGLTSITIPEGVTSIGDSAFYGCFSLEKIEVAEGNQIYHSAGNCLIETASKTLITGCNNSVIPTDGTVTSIGNSAFRYCSGLTNITIPEGVTSIGEYAFSGCRGLTNITIPEGVTSIGDSAFYGCSGLTSITIPEGVTSIGDSAFYGCFSLEKIEVAEGNQIYHSAGNCLIETASKTLITGCNNSVIPTDGTVTSIGNSAFRYCSGLTNITIPVGVTSIGNEAFSHCRVLTSITIPVGVTGIGNWAFSHCSGLTSITYNGTQAEWRAISKGSNWNYNTGNYTIHCTDGDIA